MNRIRWVPAALALALVLAFSQAYPSKPIRMVIPYATAGTTDTVGRAVSQQLSEALGQPVVINNRPGAGARLGTEIVASTQRGGDQAGIVQCCLTAMKP